METMGWRLTGKSPMFHHNGRLANPFDPFSVAIRAITSKPAKKKTEDDALVLYWLEWAGGLYPDKPLTPTSAEGAVVAPVIPEANLLSFLNDGARFNRKGADIYRGVTILGGNAKLLVPGWPERKTLRQVFDLGEFTDVRSVVLPSGGRTMRCRPIFREWSLEFSLAFDTEILSRGNLEAAAHRAASYNGLGDGKPLFGRCHAEEIAVEAVAA
jgi:hypothetical protein